MYIPGIIPDGIDYLGVPRWFSQPLNSIMISPKNLVQWIPTFHSTPSGSSWSTAPGSSRTSSCRVSPNSEALLAFRLLMTSRHRVYEASAAELLIFF